MAKDSSSGVIRLDGKEVPLVSLSRKGRALEVLTEHLEGLTDGDYLSAKELCKQTGVPVGTLSVHVQTLVERGLAMMVGMQNVYASKKMISELKRRLPK